MIARRHRLTKQDRIPALLRQGRMLMGKLIVVRFRENNRPSARFAVIVSTKIAPRAVDRNRLRRQLYELLRLHGEKFANKPHFDILILPKTSIMNATYSEIETSLLSLIPLIR